MLLNSDYHEISEEFSIDHQQAAESAIQAVPQYQHKSYYIPGTEKYGPITMTTMKSRRCLIVHEILLVLWAQQEEVLGSFVSNDNLCKKGVLTKNIFMFHLQ